MGRAKTGLWGVQTIVSAVTKLWTAACWSETRDQGAARRRLCSQDWFPARKEREI